VSAGAPPLALSIVVPVLDEAAGLPARLAALQPLRTRGAELIVVDGGSRDGTAAAASPWADRVLVAPRGRAAQMDAGARAARGAVLLFLHADTALPDAADALIAGALAGGAVWGRFDVSIAGRHPGLRLVAALMNLRSRHTGIATGDQAVFVRRTAYEAVGGFAPLPLMEDIDLSRRLRALAAPVCLRERVTTSGRRWDRHGLLRTIVQMWQLRWAWWRGADAWDLAYRYGYRPRAGAAVAVLAKAPVPGLAKTRLAPLLGTAGAARAQRDFTLATLATARAASTGPFTLWCAPDAGHRFFRALAACRGVSLRAQPAGDLGARMGGIVAAHFASTLRAQPVLLIGTDCPVLAPAHLQQAADALREHDAVLIPAEDGGYVLIGLRRPLPGVFDGVDWSTARVLDQTRDRLRAAGARWQELPALWDVDEPADWRRWCEVRYSAP
jgi:rSAM/selenodomain-associated transferase 2/rSAM/selenodomain-associated transferase 1